MLTADPDIAARVHWAPSEEQLDVFALPGRLAILSIPFRRSCIVEAYGADSHVPQRRQVTRSTPTSSHAADSAVPAALRPPVPRRPLS